MTTTYSMSVAVHRPRGAGAWDTADTPQRPSATNLNAKIDRFLKPKALRVFSGIYGDLFAVSRPTGPKAVLVCSASQGEGASTVATGLAMGTAQKTAQWVLLIDGNFHNPTVSESFGVADRSGLGDLLRGGIEADAALTESGTAGISVMGAGVALGDHLHALEPPRFRELLGRLAASSEFIVVDGPPVNAFPESVLYACQVDRVLLVVRAGVTRAPVVAKALSRLSAGGCGAVEIVLNRWTPAIPKWVYRKL